MKTAVRSPAEITLIGLAFIFSALILVVPLALIFAFALPAGLAGMVGKHAPCSRYVVLCIWCCMRSVYK